MVRNKGKLHPPKNRNKVLDTVIDFLHKHNFEETNQINKSNISKRKGLMELKTNKNTIIKGADKRGSVVIISTKHYCKMVYQHLYNKQIHKKTDSTCNNKVMNKIKKLTQKYENILTKLDIDYLTNFSASTSNFYVLPKKS